MTEEKQLTWNDCLDAVRASLVNYPNAGGDIEIMRQVERIVKEAEDAARVAGLERAAEILEEAIDDETGMCDLVHAREVAARIRAEK